jgi:hypothetical protein
MSTIVIGNEQQARIDVEAKALINRYCRSPRSSPGLITVDHITDFQTSATDNSGYQLWRYRDDCLIGIRDLRLTDDITTSSSLENTLSLEFILSGGSAMELSGQHFANHGMPLAYLSSHRSSGRRKLSRVGFVVSTRATE